MSNARRRRTVIVALAAVVAIGLTGELPQLAAGTAQSLQKLAEKQGHPEAAVKALKNLGYRVPPDVEAEAAGITPEALRQAIDQGGPLAARLETARGKKLSAEQTRQISEAERDHARQLGPARKKMIQDVAAVTGLPEAKVRKLLARDLGAPASQKQTVAQLEKQLGRRLSAADANRVGAARDQFRASVQSQRSELARDVARIANVPQRVVAELMR